MLLVQLGGSGWSALRSPRTRGLGLVLLLALASVVARRSSWVLLAPVLINLSLALSFGLTLRAGPPMIERFARLQKPDLSTAEVQWCRGWTLVWLGYFLFNVVTVSTLAFWAPLSWWVVYTGGLAYALMGVLFATEMVGRQLRFGTSPVADWFRDRLGMAAG